MIKRTLYFGNPSILSLKNEQLLLRFPEIEKNSEIKKIVENKGEITFPIEDLGMIILDHPQITISHALISKLISCNVAIVSCNETHHPHGLLLALHSNTLQSERYKEQLEASEPLKKQLWAQIIQQKIWNQSQVLKKINEKNDIDYLLKLSKSVKSGDSDNREAVAASVYWSKIFSFIDNFTRNRDGLPPNNMLNYGYAILRATLARCIVEAGLLPTLGIHHHNRYNAYCLADDLMEPYRPWVDYLVYKTIVKFGVVNELHKDVKKELMSINYVDCKMNGEISPLHIAALKTARSLQKCFEGKQRKLSLPEFT
ncbi:MAG: type II CRISPR-associated endonuclease Cas1 [Bacteroidales bacterium]|nr:type II CRISPR-associated endonuclease Cas1 [Bacteroidales bacterium]